MYSLLDFDPPQHFNQAVFMVDRHVEAGHGSLPAYHFRESTLTYATLLGLCNRAANSLRSVGVGPQERVGMVLPDRPELPITYLGAMKAGGIPVPLNPLQSADEIAHCINDSGMRAIVADEMFIDKVRAATGIAEGAPQLIQVSDGASRVLGSGLDFGRMLGEQPETVETPVSAHDDMAFWMYTSGTTGKPKAVVHRHGDLVYYQPPFAEAVLGLSEQDTLFATSKMFFSYGRNASIEMPLLYGASALLFPERPTPGGIWDAIRKHRPSIFLSVPTFYTALMEHIQAHGRLHDLSSIRLFISSGEALPQALYNRWHAMTGLEIVETLGSTDAGAQYLSNFPGRVKPGSAGMRLPRYRYEIRDEDGRNLTQGQLGTLWIHGRGNAVSYWNRPDETAETFLDGWLNTGDLMKEDEDGYYWYAGRSNDMFKVRGMWLVPGEVENELLSHPAVLECAVVSAADEEGLTQTKAVVVVRQGFDPSPALCQELRDLLAQRVAPYKVPKIVEFSSALPRTATGKIQRFQLRG